MINCICLIVKNEQPYLKEWLDYHFSLGFSKIYIFEDYGSNSHKEICDDYPDVELNSVSVAGIEDGSFERQVDLYTWFCKNYKDKMDWCAFIDIDEFIVLEDGVTLDGLFSEFRDSAFDGLGLYWKMYNANGHIKRPEGTVFENYTSEGKFNKYKLVYYYKTVVNMHRDVKWINCHKPNNICSTDFTRIDVRSMKNEVEYEKAWINHYFTKSFEDFVYRLKRGNITTNLRKIYDFFEQNPDLEDKKEELCKEYGIEYNKKCGEKKS